MNKDKCIFGMNNVNFQEFGVSSKGVQVDVENVKGIKEWSTWINASEIRYFYGLVNFYRKFGNDFSTIAVLIKIIKKNIYFQWKRYKRMIFKKFKILGIGAILIQKGHNIIYFKESHINYSTYGKDLYCMS